MAPTRPQATRTKRSNTASPLSSRLVTGRITRSGDQILRSGRHVMYKTAEQLKAERVARRNTTTGSSDARTPAHASDGRELRSGRIVKNKTRAVPKAPRRKTTPSAATLKKQMTQYVDAKVWERFPPLRCGNGAHLYAKARQEYREELEKEWVANLVGGDREQENKDEETSGPSGDGVEQAVGWGCLRC
ncbi:hypothetical protein P154DRAFT_535271 [Amniculicola lignicola CBS 123094]|uniref:Uncharacterized protein n=1 Tax=Amniculicola lignicola CBS 123094 TaxID=1392246 RepID=A0A6A5WG55_9PLEO|nr:hypothetical protein P154DRAFT_535271 [Amniculicola lignicola CBS 123094]